MSNKRLPKQAQRQLKGAHNYESTPKTCFLVLAFGWVTFPQLWIHPHESRHAFLFFSFVIHASCIWLCNMPKIMNLPPSCAFLSFYSLWFIRVTFHWVIWPKLSIWRQDMHSCFYLAIVIHQSCKTLDNEQKIKLQKYILKNLVIYKWVLP